MRREVTANAIDAEGMNFLLGRQTMKEWRLMIDHSEDSLEFKDTSVELVENEEGHLMAKLELVKNWSIDLVEKEEEVKCDKEETKIQSVTVIEQENDNGKTGVYIFHNNLNYLFRLISKFLIICS